MHTTENSDGIQVSQWGISIVNELRTYNYSNI